MNKINRAQRHTLAYSWAGSQAQSWGNQVLTHHALLPSWHEKIPRRPLGHCQVTAPPSSVSVWNCHRETLYSKRSIPVRCPTEVIWWKGAWSLCSLWSLWLALSHEDVCMACCHVLSLLEIENPSLFVFPDEKGKVLIKHFGSIFTNDFPWGCTGPSDSFLTNRIQQKWLCHLRD